MKPHIKVIQRNGVDIFVTSSMVMKATKAEVKYSKGAYNAYPRFDAGHANCLTGQEADSEKFPCQPAASFGSQHYNFMLNPPELQAVAASSAPIEIRDPTTGRLLYRYGPPPNPRQTSGRY